MIGRAVFVVTDAMIPTMQEIGDRRSRPGARPVWVVPVPPPVLVQTALGIVELREPGYLVTDGESVWPVAGSAVDGWSS